MSTTNNKEVLHSVPCTQQDNITRLTNQMERLHEIIDGNGKPGMKTDLALVVDHVKEIRLKLSSSMEVNNELEIQRRVALELDKRKEEIHQKRMGYLKLFVAFTGGVTGLILIIREIWKALN